MEVNLAGRLVGKGHPPYLIAEIGANHNGDIELAKRMIDAAKRCGADAVKFQSWSSTSLISRAEYARNTSYADTDRHFGSLLEMVQTYQLTPLQHHELVNYCSEQEIHFLSSAFSPEEVDLLVEIDVPALKVASMDVNHPVLLRRMAETGKPVLLSTGMASMAEIAGAVDTLRGAGCRELVVLHCVSLYPPPDTELNLRNIGMLETAFQVPVGFSDHSLGTAIALGAVALGACIVEKHFTLDKAMPGWDHWMSADPEELTTISGGARQIHQALGSSARIVGGAELDKRKKFRRCIVLRNKVSVGHKLQLADLDFKRPGTAIPPTDYPYVVGRTVRRDLEADHELSWSDLE